METAVICYLRASSSPQCFRPKMARCLCVFFPSCCSVNHAICMSLIIAGIERLETEVVGRDRGDVMLTLINSLAVWPSVIKLLCSALTAVTGHDGYIACGRLIWVFSVLWTSNWLKVSLFTNAFRITCEARADWDHLATYMHPLGPQLQTIRCGSRTVALGTHV